MKKLLLLTAIFVIALSSVVPAQQQESSISPKKPEGPGKLMLEISYNPAVPPAYTPVLASDKRAAWTWVTQFVRIKGREMSPPVQAVKVETQYNGETADVRVTLLRGIEGFDREDLVGTYHVGIGEKLTVNDLSNAGVEPFNITLLDTLPPVPPPPAFENMTKSIEIISIEAVNVPRPAYKITVRNLSDKSVRALQLYVLSDGRPANGAFWQGDEGRSIIEPGGTVERSISALRTETTPTGYAPGTAARNTVLVRSVLFSDMSFEGQREPACLVESYEMGRRLWLKKVLALLDQELSTKIEDHIAAARQFKEKFSALRYEFDEKERNQPSAVSPDCPKPFDHAHITPELLKLQMLRELDDVITKRPAPSVNFKSWLETRRTSYQAWLARL